MKNKKEISLNLESKLKKNNISKTFIKKEFNLLFKNPIFFIQCVYPVITFMVTLVILIVTLIPKIYGLLQTEEYSNITYTYPNKYYGLYGVDLMLTTDGKF